MSVYSIEGAEPEWEAFVASVDPDELEHERFGTPGRDERPGSAADRWMRECNQARVAAFRAAARNRSGFERLDAAVAEAREWLRRHEAALTDEHVRVAMVAAGNTERGAA